MEKSVTKGILKKRSGIGESLRLAAGKRNFVTVAFMGGSLTGSMRGSGKSWIFSTLSVLLSITLIPKSSLMVSLTKNTFLLLSSFPGRKIPGAALL